MFAYAITDDGQISKPPSSQSFIFPLNSVSQLVPEKRYLAWSSLSEAEIQIANNHLGYSKKTWDTPGSNILEKYRYDDLSESGKNGATSLGLGNAIWDCHINHYVGFTWSDLAAGGFVQYATSLGWDENKWDNNGSDPETEDFYWDDLTLEQQAAASQICYFKDLWDGLVLS